MKSPNEHIKPAIEKLESVTLLSDAVHPARRFTDLTPASREMQELKDVPTSPKIHELIERSKFH
jgi:hypothetical protein